MTETLRLINAVREAAGRDLLTMQEKLRLHTAASRYRRNRRISADDLAWLRQMDSNFEFIAAMKKPSKRGKGSP
jgi:hypothetical protein